MTVLVVGSRPPVFAEAAARLGVDHDVVYDPEETPRTPEVAPRRVFWLPYMSAPESVLGLPDLHRYDGIVSFTDYGAMAATLATAVCDLPGPPVDAVLRTRNKYLMRQALRRAGLAQPAFGRLGHDVPEPHHFPIVVKPLDGTGSSGLRLVTAAPGLGVVPLGRAMMWESHLEGPQYTVEGIARADHHEALAVTGKVISGPPHFVVLEHDTPAELDDALRRRITDYVADCLGALGVRHTATHTEVAVHHGEPKLIETHTRPAGDQVPFITRLTTGWEQSELGLVEACRAPLTARPHPVVGRFARTIHFTPYDSDRTALANPAWLAEHPEVIAHDLSRIYSNRSSSHDSRWGHDPRWGNVVIAGPERDTLRTVSKSIRTTVRPT
ncbi:MAG TPA: ATP-grasp domain-containing protein [Pseudonocardiaceae bacterium]